MQFKPTLALCAAFLAAVAEGRIAFTTLPSSVKAGSPVNLAWDGADGTPITITLKRGSSNNLQTVALITGNASGNSYSWTPSTSLENGSDYALQITQDDTDINYTGLFTISGGSSSSSSSSTSSTSSSSTAAAAAVAGGAYASSSGMPYNSANATTAAPSGTAPASAGSTGASVSRNTTMSSATLSASSSGASGSASSSGASGASGSSATATSAKSASGTSSSSTAAPTNAAVNIASNFGLLLAGMVAVVYLG